MSQRSVEQALGKMVTDEAFRREFSAAGPREPGGRSRSLVHRGERRRRASHDAGWLGASLGDRICRLAIPEGTPGGVLNDDPDDSQTMDPARGAGDAPRGVALAAMHGSKPIAARRRLRVTGVAIETV
jgi:hypothetical protein